jgi:hypothetical protein
MTIPLSVFFVEREFTTKFAIFALPPSRSTDMGRAALLLRRQRAVKRRQIGDVLVGERRRHRRHHPVLTRAGLIVGPSSPCRSGIAAPSGGRPWCCRGVRPGRDAEQRPSEPAPCAAKLKADAMVYLEMRTGGARLLGAPHSA